MTFNEYKAKRAKPASKYKTYNAYCIARQMEGLQVMPKKLWESLKKGN